MRKRIVALLLVLCAIAALFSGCTAPAAQQDDGPGSEPLPAPSADPDSMFGVDENINMETIDNYLGRDDVAYIDVRMLFDPADYSAIGGEADLTRTIQGFKIVPFPYIATLSPLPVSGAYAGPCLYTLAWDEEGGIASAVPNYMESELILSELFPKDKAIFIMCGGGGYSAMIKSLLIYLGWDENLLYNIGANWSYNGANRLELVIYPDEADGDIIYATWRADYAYIEFEKLHPVEE